MFKESTTPENTCMFKKEELEPTKEDICLLKNCKEEFYRPLNTTCTANPLDDDDEGEGPSCMDFEDQQLNK